MKKEKIPDLSGCWNYRIIQDDELFSIVEVWYTKKGKPMAWTSKAPLCYADVKEFKHDFKLMKQAFSRPILKVKGNKLYEQRTKTIY